MSGELGAIIGATEGVAGVSAAGVAAGALAYADLVNRADHHQKKKKAAYKQHEKDVAKHKQYTKDWGNAVDKSFKDFMEQKKVKRSLEHKDLKDKAFSKLAYQPGISKRRAELDKTSKEGMSSAERALAASKVSSAVRGQAASVSRRMQSLLAGQGVRGVQAAQAMKSIDQQAAKQKTTFDMAQMAKSYDMKRQASDKKAELDMDVAQFDISQDKSKLAYNEARELEDRASQVSLFNTLMQANKGKLSPRDFKLAQMGLGGSNEATSLAKQKPGAAPKKPKFEVAGHTGTFGLSEKNVISEIDREVGDFFEGIIGSGGKKFLGIF